MLRVDNLRKRYGTTVALDGLSFRVEAGEIFGLLGPNGAGKSTAVNIAMGLAAPDSGEVEIVGFGNPSRPEVRSQLGLTPQSLALYEELTGEENLSFFGKLQGMNGARLRDRVNWALEFVALTDRAGHRVKTYSGGMKRRLNLAVALIHDPKLLLLDEPTVGVDPQSRNAIFDKVLELRAAGTTIVYTTHYMEEAQRLCDRVGIVDHGKLLALNTVNELVRQHGGKERVLAETLDGPLEIEPQDPIAELAALRTSGKLVSFAMHKPTLENVFLNLTGRHLRDG